MASLCYFYLSPKSLALPCVHQIFKFCSLDIQVFSFISCSLDIIRHSNFLYSELLFRIYFSIGLALIISGNSCVCMCTQNYIWRISSKSVPYSFEKEIFIIKGELHVSLESDFWLHQFSHMSPKLLNLPEA